MFLASAVTSTQISSISTALSGAISNVLDTFISLLPIMALAVGVVLAIRIVKGRFREVKRAG